MKSIMGITPPRAGRNEFNGEAITGKPAYQLCRKEIGFVPDDRRVFADLTVGENLEISERRIKGKDVWDRKRAYAFFPPLRGLAGRRAGVLQQMLTIGRALNPNSGRSETAQSPAAAGSRHRNRRTHLAGDRRGGPLRRP